MFFLKFKTVKSFSNLNNKELSLTICDINQDLCNGFAEVFKEMNQVRIVCGDILKIKADAIISPANSFGDMSGGIDKSIDQFYQGKAQVRLSQTIKNHFLGELPVGIAHIIPMNTKNFRYLIAAPTMRIPGILRNDSINAYLAMRAILVQVLKHNESSADKIQHIVMPGLGTGVGGMSFQESANQMLIAYKNICLHQWKEIVHPMMAPFVLRK